MNYQGKLFSNGMKPVYKIEGLMKKYKRIPGDLIQNVTTDFNIHSMNRLLMMVSV
jgi:hypothetical protein